ncbi:MAG: DUF4230 domain-containing protein, partial [Cytophagales bacterium]|nr:DUF4230 domain-containing protein [Cytophagales bacterium]
HWPFSDQKEYQHVIDSSVILHEVENLGKLELVKYNFKEIFEYRRLSDGRIIENAILNTANYNPDLSVVLVASGEAVGCIDLTKLEVNHLKIDSDTIVISLPTPELCYHKLDLENTRIISYSKESWWSRIFSDESEKNEILHLAYQKAEKRLEEAAIESGIYASANKNIEIILKPFIERLTGKNVRIVSSLPNLDVSSNR